MAVGGDPRALQRSWIQEVDVYWEGEDEDGEANGVFRKRTKADNDPCWNAYIVATGK